MQLSNQEKNTETLLKIDSTYKIVSTHPGEIYFELFKNFPSKIYSEEELRFKQTESVSSDHLVGCYLLFRNEEIVGRFALYNNLLLFYNNKKAACIGSYECINEEEASKALLGFARQEAQKTGAEFLIGPMEGSTWNNYRFSNYNYHPNFFLEPYHHTHYNQHFIDNGFACIAEYESTLAPKFSINTSKVNALEKDLKSKGLTFRKLDITNIDTELLKLAYFSNEAFKENFLYTPINPNVFVEKYKKIIPFINPEYVWMAEESNGNLVGVHFCYDSKYQHQKTLVIKSLARSKNKNYNGLGNYLAAKLINKAFNDGYEYMIYAFMQKNNTSVMKLSDELKAVEYKSYSLYGTSLHHP